MDLSKLSDADLLALRDGDLSKVSDAGLMELRGPTPVEKFNAKSGGATGTWQERTGAEVATDALKNLPSSAGNFANSIYQAVRHPIDTAGNIADLAVGGFANLMPKAVNDLLASGNSPEQSANVARAVSAADAVGGALKDRYRSVDALKNTIATDPVGAAADLSTVLTGGSTLVPKLAVAAKLTNPLSLVAPAVKGAAQVGGVVGKNMLGMSTGIGAENIAQAASAGLNNKTAFYDNLSGKTSMTDVLDAAKQNLQVMGQKKGAEYRSGMVDIKNDKTVLGFGGIDKALQDANGAVTFKGQVKNAKGADVVKAIETEVANWKSLNPAEFHTPEGLDALKQKIGGIVESIPFEEKTARMVAGNVYNSVKDEIARQAPTYAKVMKDYSQASDTIKEIERALSLGNKTAADTAMRKLQSLSRNNVNTNYGNRLTLAKTLEQQGGTEILPALSGQAMNTWTPRGLAGLGGPATMGAAAYMHNPALLGLLPLQSPRVVGSLLYGAGQGLRPIKGLLDASPITADRMATGGLLLGQAGRQP